LEKILKDTEGTSIPSIYRAQRNCSQNIKFGLFLKLLCGLMLVFCIFLIAWFVKALVESEDEVFVDPFSEIIKNDRTSCIKFIKYN
jgi:hypothetical protein